MRYAKDKYHEAMRMASDIVDLVRKATGIENKYMMYAYANDIVNTSTNSELSRKLDAIRRMDPSDSIRAEATEMMDAIARFAREFAVNELAIQIESGASNSGRFYAVFEKQEDESFDYSVYNGKYELLSRNNTKSFSDEIISAHGAAIELASLLSFCPEIQEINIDDVSRGIERKEKKIKSL